jgi:Tol biopolymer transport system component
MKLFGCCIIAAALAFGQGAPDVQLRAAIHKEEVEGDLKGAIEQYRRIGQGKDRSAAAKALVRIGECYEKQGNTDARKTYEQVLSRFADQTEAVAQARARLAKLGGVGAAKQPATKLVWGGPTADGDSVSPDGRYLTYTNRETGNLVLYNLESGADRVLTVNGSTKPGQEEFADESVISKDGKQVAYSWFDEKTKGQEPWVVDLDGDPKPRRLFNGQAEVCDWSPDGKWILVIWADGHSVQLGLLSAQGGVPRALKSWPIGRRSFSARFSPDGKYIVYTCRIPDGSYQASILSADGKSETALAPGSSGQNFARWSADGSRIVWVTGNPGTDLPALWSIRVTNGKPVGEPEQLKANFGNSSIIGFAHDGALYYRNSTPESDIYLADLDPATGKLTSEPMRVSRHAPGASNGQIRWLPDGKSLSFWSNREGHRALVVHNLATGDERELWEQPTEDGGPFYTGWFPDGSVMAWQRQPPNGNIPPRR